MFNNYFVFIGPDSERGENQYWAGPKQEWIEDIDKAIHYTNHQVFFIPPPIGSEAIVEFTSDHIPVNYYNLLIPPPPEVEVTIP